MKCVWVFVHSLRPFLEPLKICFVTVLLKVGILVTNNLLNFLNEFRTSENLHFYKDKKNHAYTRTMKRRQKKTFIAIKLTKLSSREFLWWLTVLPRMTKKNNIFGKNVLFLNVFFCYQHVIILAEYYLLWILVCWPNKLIIKFWDSTHFIHC